jgi:hypothetical protein
MCGWYILMLVLALVGLYVQTQSLIYDMGVIVHAPLLSLLTVHPPHFVTNMHIPSCADPITRTPHPLELHLSCRDGHAVYVLYIQPFHFSTHSRYFAVYINRLYKCP